MRLASAYIALGNHSNDACLSLQRALSLDKNNKVARDMLVKEMRQRNNRERTGESSSGVSGSERSEQERNNEGDRSASTPLPTPSAPPPEQSSQSTNNGGRSNINYDGIDLDDVNTPPSLSFTEKIQYYFAEFLAWFDSQSDDIKTLVKVGFCFLILYVALGGRFGLDYALSGGQGVSRGNYSTGNAYERYYNDQYKERSYNSGQNTDPHRRTTTSDSSGYNDRTTKQNAKYYSQYQNNNGNSDYYEPPPRKTRRSTSYHMVRILSLYILNCIHSFLILCDVLRFKPNLFDGSMSSMGILLAVGLVCHYAGINPMQVMMMLNMMNGRRGHRGFGGYGGYNMGGGFGRRRRFGGRRGRW